MNRRRLLLSYLANSFSWELYSKVYFYNELIPTTINTKSVLNKAKIVKVSGNGVIENQLVDLKQSNLSGSGVSYSFADNKATFTSTVAGGNRCAITHLSFVSGHKYLISFDLTQSKTGTCRFQIFNHNYSAVFNGETFSLTANVKQKCSFITTANFTDSEVGTNISVYMQQNGTTAIGDTLIVENAMCIDLTLREGTGNEPTSLTDNRIQNILNRDYIPFNLGKYKESDIGLISSEPYNLFDGELEGGSINAQGINASNSDNFRSKNYMEVVGGKTYTFEYVLSAIPSSTMYLIEYDSNKSKIKDTSVYAQGSHNFVLTNETCYVRFQFYRGGTNWINNPPSQNDLKCCFHRTGTRTGYAPHQSFTPITFKAQLGGANTMEITSSAYVFTRNYNTYRFSGSESWSLYNGVLFYTNISGGRTGDGQEHPVDLRCSKYACKQTTQSGYTASNGSDLTASWDRTNSQLLVKDTNYSSTSTFATSMTGVVIQYPLATPQVITIPKKHLGIKRIRDLSWGYTTANGHSVFYTTGVRTGNNYAVYCSQYLYDAGSIANNQIRNDTYFGSNYLYITDDRYTSTTDFFNECGDYYIFYETENEVADIENVIDIESGGTITTDSEVLANIELSVKCK